MALDNMELLYLFEQRERSEHDPLYLAARGVAEIAKVWQGSEWNCLQHISCTIEMPENDGKGVC